MRPFTALAIVLIVVCILPSAAEGHTAEMESDPSHVMVMQTTPAPASHEATPETTITGAGDYGVWQSLVEESHAAHSGGFTGHTDDDLCKIYVIVLGIRQENVFVESADIRYGHPPNTGYQNGDLVVTIRARNGTPLLSYRVWDPRITVDVYGFHDDLLRHEGMEDPALEAGMGGEDIDLPLIIPFHKDIYSVELADSRTGTILTSVNLMPAVDRFKSRFPHDPDMIRQVQVYEPMPFLVTSAVMAAILVSLLFVLIRRAK